MGCCSSLDRDDDGDKEARMVESLLSCCQEIDSALQSGVPYAARFDSEAFATPRNAIRALGEELWRTRGLAGMQEVAEKLKTHPQHQRRLERVTSFSDVRILEIAWDGIGEWQM